MTALDVLEKLQRPFRHAYLNFDEVTAQIHAWADAFPHLCSVKPLARSPEGRPLWLMTLGGGGQGRPAVWVDANMHATELCGVNVALAVAEDVLRLHLGGDEGQGLPEHLRTILKEVTFHVLPCMSPDGAEAVRKTGRYVRSNPRDARPARALPRWRACDVDGDGTALLMRQQDPSGDYVESAVVPRLMVPRQVEDPPPYYKLYPEGLVDNWDGFTVPDPDFLSDTDTDMNRNFPYLWAQEPQQEGSGAFPLSEPEARAVVEFAVAHPEIFAWVNLHTFGGVFIRPLGDGPDTKMKPLDLAVYRQLEAWAQECTGYPMVSGFHQFLYEPDKPLHGSLSDYAFRERGCISYVTELWDLFARTGQERRTPFVDHYSHIDRAGLERIGRWDTEHNQGRTFRPWRRFEHPQLGPVEVGGLDTREGLSNPPREVLAELCSGHTKMTLMLACLAPRLVITRAEVEALGPDAHAVHVRVENQGYLPSHIMDSAKDLPFSDEVHVCFEADDGCQLQGGSKHVLGHLEGWGRGRFAGGHALFFQRSRGTGSARQLTVVVRGRGKVKITAACCRAGSVSTNVVVGA